MTQGPYGSGRKGIKKIVAIKTAPKLGANPTPKMTPKMTPKIAPKKKAKKKAVK